MFRKVYMLRVINPAFLQVCNKVTLSCEPYGCAKCKRITKYTWTTDSHFTVSVINYGGIITNICVPDKHGKMSDVVLGFDDLESWSTANVPYFGCTVGRCANVISNAKFVLDGKKYKLPKNLGEHSLHGGLIGFDKAVWSSKVEGKKVILSYLSEDGEEGYPGDLITNLALEVCDDDTLHAEFISQTDKPTVVNLTNHSYFNLGGHDSGAKGLFDHLITINADCITDDDVLDSVKNTPFDLRTPTKLCEIYKEMPEMFDTNYCVNTYKDMGVRFLARAHHEPSGRFFEIHSDAPGLQFYTGNFIPDEKGIMGKGGICYRKFGGLCLQPQHYPDAINNRKFPSPIIRPGHLFRRIIKYKFGVYKDDGKKTPCMRLTCPRCP